MTVRMKLNEFTEQFQETGAEDLLYDPTDELDCMFKFDLPFSQGWSRKISLREDIYIEITQNQIRDRLILTYPETGDYDVGCQFFLAGDNHWRIASPTSEISWTNTAGKYMLYGAGSRNQLIIDYDAAFFSSTRIEVHQNILRSFATSSEGELPQPLQHLTRTINRSMPRYFGNIQSTMAVALQQMSHCPYQGMFKRAYLESKAIELMVLVLADVAAVQSEEAKQLTLKPEQVEQIHYAREILLRDMYNPPSLIELAHQVGLNDFLLKKGFRQVFGNTVFGELQAYRLELARQLLSEGNLSAAEISRLAGYVHPNSFARAFKQKFNVTPSAYRKSCRLT